MYEPIPPESHGKMARNRLREQYFSKKDEYLELCWQYNLPPRDLGLLLMGRRNIAAADRIRIIRLVIQLMDMEKFLGPDIIRDYLFEDESRYHNSGIFPADLH